MSKPRTSWTFLNAPLRSSFLWSLVLTLLPVLSSFIVSWVIARWGGETVWGTVSWTMAFATAALIVAKLGLGLGASRLASEYGVDRTGNLRSLFYNGFAILAVVTIAVAAVAALFAAQIAAWFHNAELLGPIRIGALVVVCASFYEYQEHFLVGLNRHSTVSSIRLTMLSLRVVFTLLLVLTGAQAAWILGGYVLAWGIGIALFALLLHRFLPPRNPDQSAHAMRSRLLSISLPLAVSSASVTIYSQMDKLMLGYFDSVEEVGHYAIARAVAEVALFPAFAMVMTLRPALASRFGAGAVAECAALIRRSLRLCLVFGVLFASILAVQSVPLFQFVYSDEFVYAGELMRFFAIVIIMRSVGALVLPALLAAERTRTYAVLTTLSAILNFILNLILIPRMHSAGAIVATVVSYAFLLVLGLGRVMKVFGVKADVRALSVSIRTLLAGVICSAITWGVLEWLVPAGYGSWAWLVIVWTLGQAALYTTLAVGLGIISARDLRSFLPPGQPPVVN